MNVLAFVLLGLAIATLFPGAAVLSPRWLKYTLLTVSTIFTAAGWVALLAVGIR